MRAPFDRDGLERFAAEVIPAVRGLMDVERPRPRTAPGQRALRRSSSRRPTTAGSRPTATTTTASCYVARSRTGGPGARARLRERPATRWTTRNAGLDVEGIDSSADMLAICRAHAERRRCRCHVAPRRLDHVRPPPSLRDDLQPRRLVLLIEDDSAARGAARRPGCGTSRRAGRLCVAMGIPRADFAAQLGVEGPARARPAGRRHDVHGARGAALRRRPRRRCTRCTGTSCGTRDGELVTTFMRRHRLRWWTGEQLEAMLLESGAGAASSDSAPTTSSSSIADAPASAATPGPHAAPATSATTPDRRAGSASRPTTAKPWPS